MNPLRFSSITTQVTGFMREALLAGRWKGTLPGREQLCKELGASPKTIRLAIEQLEKEGLLIPEGKGRRRTISAGEHHPAGALRIWIFPYEDADRGFRHTLDMKQRLIADGHEVQFAERSLCELKMDVGKIASHAAACAADAWVVFAAPRQVLEWFISRPTPVFAMLGSMRGLAIAGAKPDKIQAQREALQRLHALGHRRIVQLSRNERLFPRVGTLEQAFLQDLQSLGLHAGPYNLAGWDGTKKGLRERLDNLFRITPPTALLISELPEFIATQQYAARRGLFAPEKISLICSDPDPAFAFCDPAISHIAWSFDPIARRISEWAGRVAKGKKDFVQSLTKATFVEGGTIGPVPKS